MSIGVPNAATIAVPRSGIARLFLLSFITGFSGAIMPGPLLVSVIEQTTVQGFRAVVGLIAGHALLELVIVALLVLGLQRVLQRSRVRGAIGLIGGTALVYMGVDMLRSVGHVSLDLNMMAHAAFSWPQLIAFGALISIANPYFTGWWATIGMGQLAQMAPRTVTEYGAFYVGHELSDFTWYAFVGLLIVTGRRWLTDGIFHGLIIICAGIIVALGLMFLASGVKFLRRVD
jgi:threonine/homoserine/homoserine lactone efflux protein